MDDVALEAWTVIDLVTPLAVRIAATTGLLGRIVDAPVPIPELAAELALTEDVLRRLLRPLAVRQVVRLEGDRAVATEVGRALADGPTGAFSARLDWAGAAGELDRLVISEALSAVRGAAPDRLWDRLDRDPELSRSFDALMSARATEWIAPVAAHPLWSGVDHVLELGGGRGHLLRALLDAWPRLRGTLLDRAAVITDLAGSEAVAAGRLRLEPGDFFGDVPTGADVYLLAHVLHDWDDEQAIRILASAARAAGPHGRVVVVERVVPEQLTADAATLETAIQDLRLFVLFGGGERTEQQFRTMADRAGLALGSIDPLTGHRQLLVFRAT
ncbi:methyltransferase [Microlunatus speluncae]|uniref:methyltransferase n=1 Tax=Microlunatus speluncae TaxID=2594267 RepID=UPI0012665EBD|nr:methyltransferase [Microlunatus speluncae]